jgi:hypothetical protein
MSVSIRVNFLAWVLAFVILSCGPAETTSTSPAVPVMGSETPIPTAIPKQNDLIFIEFFAGT